MACSCNAQPCECDPNLTVTAEQISLLAGYINTIEDVVESPALTTTTPGGREIDTLTGALTKLGFQPPIAYAAGIEFTAADGTKTIERDGLVYAPIPSALPFTTSGTWAADDETKFFLVQGVYLYDGTVVIVIATVADMKGDANLQVGNVVRTEGYLASGDLGAAWYKIVPAGTGPADDGTFIDLTASGLQAQAISDSDRINVAQYGAVGNGTVDDSARIQAAIDAVSAYGGGELEFPLTGGGVYLCNVIVKPNVSLRGASREVTLKPFSNSPVITTKTDENIARFSIKELTIDGSDSQGTFTAQDGIRIAPDDTFQHISITLEDVKIVNCGASGIALFGGDVSVSEQVGLVDMNRCSISMCTGPGLDIQGNVAVSGAENCDITDNGDGTDAKPNILIQAAGPATTPPQSITLRANRLITESYISAGTCLGIFGALDVTILDNDINEFHTGIKIGTGPNGVIRIQGNRFERSVGDIDSLVEVLDVNGFIYDGNNVNAATTGPIGLLLPGSSANAKRVSIGDTNSFGGLTNASDILPITQIAPADTVIQLPNNSGAIPLNLTADGSASVNTLNDFNGGTEQLVHGQAVNLSISNALRTITLVDGTGNIRLAGGVDFTLNELGDNITLAWYEGLGAWVERSRVSLT